MKDSECAVQTEIKFSVTNKLCIEKTGSFLVARKNKMIPGNIKLLVSIVILCKWPTRESAL